MMSDEYVRSIIAKYAQTSRPPAVTAAANSVAAILRTWGGQYVIEISYSGSSAKGTAIRGLADVDLFISLSPQTSGTLADIYNSLLKQQ
jgi:tRNA nucleotidyltransferase (CCA-adding enzyme)